MEDRKAKPVKNREAACSCGQLRLTCLGDPVRVSMCHCLECQRRTGSPFGVQGWYPREQVLPAKGVAKQYEHQADSGRTVTFNFCPECGAPSQWACLLIPILKDPVSRSGRAGSNPGLPPLANRKSTVQAENRTVKSAFTVELGATSNGNTYDCFWHKGESLLTPKPWQESRGLWTESPRFEPGAVRGRSSHTRP
jgi:Glutathione-dependent formaldehyde-activating enzyme